MSKGAKNMTGEIIYDVPIFPLDTVLFPSMPLPLHIFEERYRTMVKNLKHGDNRFCVALIREGQEVGGYAAPYEVACLAELVHTQPLQDGRYFIVAVGIERVRIVSIERDSKPYLTGSVEMWPDESKDADPKLVEKASKLFLQYIQYILKLAGQDEEKIPMPTEPDLLSYLMATSLQVEAEVRQSLLEMPSSEQRIQAELEMLQSELPLLRAFMSTPQPPSVGFGQFSAN
jgi:Lon protease-like protein